MSIRFRCPKCDQSLNAPPRMATRRIRCPHCRKAITVPQSATASAAVENPTAKKHSAPSTSLAPSAGVELSEDIVRSGMDLVYDQPAVTLVVDPEPHAIIHFPESHEIDHQMVTISRRALYLQATVIFLIGVGGFALGFIMAVIGEPDHVPTSVATGPIEISGRLMIRTQAGSKPDSDAAVLILPVREAALSEDRKFPIYNLGPDDTRPIPDGKFQQKLAALGGVYTRTENDGKFVTPPLAPGSYYCLLISNNIRPDAPSASNEDIEILGRYLKTPAELLNPYSYELSLRTLSDNDSTIDKVFGE